MSQEIDQSRTVTASTHARVVKKPRRQGQRMTAVERKVAQDTFIKAMSNTANVRAACMVAGIAPKTVYQWKEHDLEFGIRFREANEQATWILFGEGWRRAVQGEKEYVVANGKLVYGPDGQPLVQYKKSDRLLELYLKARLSEFRDKSTLTIQSLPKEYVGFDPSLEGTEE